MPDPNLALRQLPFPAFAPALGIDLAKYQRKGHDWAGPCPIHGSKNNVGCFRYEVEGGRWHCFSCSAKGRGSIDLAIAVKGIGFQPAVDLLSPIASTPRPQQKEPPQGDSDATDQVLKPYSGSYEKYQEDCPWLENRIPDKAIREKYGVFCYNNVARKSAYSGRVMIPIKDAQGLLFGYLGRLIPETLQSASGQQTDSPKYLFPKALPKSRFLFGAFELRQHLLSLGTGQSVFREVYLLESPFACMKFAMLGLPAVSSFGWSVSTEQCQILKGIARAVVYIPDSNKHEEAAKFVHILAQSLWVKFPSLPPDITDPESLDREAILALTR